MGRSTAYLQAEIDAIEALLQSSQGLYLSFSSDGTSRSIERSKLEARLDQLYIQLGRANGTAPQIVRGVTKGLGNR